ncbi:capsular associated protein [Thozetella sp. PMI_491]|nr:capsular associated protein [Thozetella sp. PMI_491]
MLQRWRRILVICLAAVCSLVVYFQYSWDVFSYGSPVSGGPRFGDPPSYGANPQSSTQNGTHPIDDLIHDAHLSFNQLLGKRSTTLEQAAWRYRERRGRHPPPGFDAWFAAAKKKDAVVVEEFFDRIYHDLTPLWALEPREMRARTHNQRYVIRVRKGKVEYDKTLETPFERLRMWAKLVGEMMPHIPDLDMAVNEMDETRILVPWEKIDEYVAVERRQRRLIEIEEATSQYSGLGDVEGNAEAYDPGWIRGQSRKYWDHFNVGCAPDSPGRNVSAIPDFNVPIEYPLEPVAAYTYQGYVRNFTASKDPCLQPHLRGMHGTFVDSISMATTHELLPLFGESKLLQNNEILIPGAVYLDKSRGEYNGGWTHGGGWRGKKDAIMWRGAASGARNQKEQWWHLHRNRFIQMLNGSTVAAAEAGDESQPRTFRLLPADKYGVEAQKEGKLGAWVSRFSDAGFIDFLCDPADFYKHWWYGEQRKPGCSWLEPWFSVASSVSMKKQYSYKYLPDIDGNSYSGRYRAFLQSSSLPLKSSIYAEWHDDRLFPWVHFVPFDNSFMDIYGIMDYFLRGRDAEAERIAMEGQRWAQAVLRRDDMRLYVWRLLLEYARVVDDNRERLAFVDDLKN